MRHLDKEQKLDILKKHLCWESYKGNANIIAKQLGDFTLHAMQDLNNALTEIIRETQQKRVKMEKTCSFYFTKNKFHCPDCEIDFKEEEWERLMEELPGETSIICEYCGFVWLVNVAVELTEN